MTRHLQSLKRKLCKIDEKRHMANLRHFSIGFAAVVNMSSPHWRGVTAKRPRIAWPGFKPHGQFRKTGKLAELVQTNNTANWNRQYRHAIGWQIMAAKLQLRHQQPTYNHTAEE